MSDVSEARIGAGLNYVYYGVVDANGYLQGNSADGPSAGAQAGEGMTRLEGAQVFPIGVPEDEIITVLGDNEPLVTFKFPSAELASGVFEMAASDLDFEALVQGTKVEILGDLRHGLLSASGATSPTIALLIQNQSKKWASGARGTAAWEYVLLLAVEVTPLFKDVEQRTHSPYRYNVNLSKADRATYGATLSETTHGAEKAAYIVGESDNPVHLHAWQGNNAETAFTLTFTPKATGKVYLFVNGVRQVDPGDYSVSGTTITFVAAPASASRIIAIYEVDADVIT